MNEFLQVKTDKLMNKIELAAMCKAYRLMKNMTQGDVADLIKESRGLDKFSKQSVSAAEDPDKGSVDSLRIEIIELLSGRTLSGPYWKFEPEPVEEGG